MLKNKFFRIAYSIILILVIIFLLGQINYIIKPVKTLLSTLMVPVLIGIFLYYLLRPLVSFLTGFLKYKTIAILISFILIIGLIFFVSYFGGSIISKQINSLIKDSSNYYESIRANLDKTLLKGKWIMTYLERFNIEERLTSFIENVFNSLKNNISGFFSTLTNIGTVVILIPFVLFYFLKDDWRIHQAFLKLFPFKEQERIEDLLRKIDQTLSRYISGQLIIAFILGLLTYIGYLIIGLPNALILALIAMVTSFIPFIGAILGIIPAIFIGLTTDLFLIVKILIVLIIVQQLEGNVIQPRIQGNRLEIHPLIVIFSVMSFVILFGFLGALFAVPTYAVLRVIIKEFRDF